MIIDAKLEAQAIVKYCHAHTDREYCEIMVENYIYDLALRLREGNLIDQRYIQEFLAASEGDVE